MSVSSESEWATAVQAMNDHDRTAANALRDRFLELGADDPDMWALSEISQDIPQLARFLALRHVWPDMINSYADSGALES